MGYLDNGFNDLKNMSHLISGIYCGKKCKEVLVRINPPLLLLEQYVPRDIHTIGSAKDAGIVFVTGNDNTILMCDSADYEGIEVFQDGNRKYFYKLKDIYSDMIADSLAYMLPSLAKNAHYYYPILNKLDMDYAIDEDRPILKLKLETESDTTISICELFESLYKEIKESLPPVDLNLGDSDRIAIVSIEFYLNGSYGYTVAYEYNRNHISYNGNLSAVQIMLPVIYDLIGFLYECGINPKCTFDITSPYSIEDGMISTYYEDCVSEGYSDEQQVPSEEQQETSEEQQVPSNKNSSGNESKLGIRFPSLESLGV